MKKYMLSTVIVLITLFLPYLLNFSTYYLRGQETSYFNGTACELEIRNCSQADLNLMKSGFYIQTHMRAGSLRVAHVLPNAHGSGLPRDAYLLCRSLWAGVSG